MKKIILTGFNGFVGQNLSSYLANHPYNILNLGRSLGQNVDYSWDNLDKIEKEPVDIIIHSAGKAHDLKKTSNPEDYYKINYELTKELYDAFLNSAAKKFIFISSVKAAADTVHGVLTEDEVPLPETDYGKSKLMAEQYIQTQILPAGKAYYILRPCMIHGPGNKGNLNLLYQFVQKGIPYPLAAFHNRRSFLSVENLCFVIRNVIDHDDLPSGIYNVADDEPLSTSEVVRILAKSSGNKPILWHIPIGFVKVLAKIGDFLKLPLNSERLTKMTENYVVSNKKIKNALRIDFPKNAMVGLGVTADSFVKD
ncbi:nucleoside-diphosphate-sugar epimerase [Pedobacter africanus]|uniref:Nucleoside-diphosphate-sugar epimerase n=1 Tax=Pedobacter africanus TaxID=151894 RepID=A0ACC6L402_9SPHI|nr:NAD-dependent epimerase/dehydratase family protein [Pedobacter africanus]MDR6786150.1 nucleoside-diphosphate-sugar epimerase [Pedobacter africanus]